MIPKDTLELTLKARETVSIPFVFLSFASGPVSMDGYSMRAETRSRKDARLQDGDTSNGGWESNRSGGSSKDTDRDGGSFESKDGRGDSGRDGGRDGGRDSGRDGRGSIESKDGGSGSGRGRDDEQGRYDDIRQKAFGTGVAIRRRTVPISFKSAHHGHTVALLQVHVRPRPFVVHRTFRFHQSENEFMKRR